MKTRNVIHKKILGLVVTILFVTFSDAPSTFLPENYQHHPLIVIPLID